MARAALWALVPAELLVLVLLVSGLTLPPVLGRSLEVVALTALFVVAMAAFRLFRAHRRRSDRRDAAAATYRDLVPERVRRILGFDARGTVSLVLWAMRRRHGVPPGAAAISYSRAQTTPMSLFLFAMVIELIGVDLLFRHFGWPEALRITVLVIDGYSALVVLAVIAACITRPHVITEHEVRLRYGAFFDLRIPRGQVARVSRVRHMDEQGLVRVEGEELSLAVSSQTNLTVTLTEPITAIRPLGAAAQVRSIRFFADDPRAALAALAALEEEPTDREGTGRSRRR